MPLTAGVLIIGSLLWDSETERSAWRAARLNVAAAQTVTAPIRYGRFSESRGNSYTMVFSRTCPAGQAKLVPCSNTISTVQDLIAEAEHLWNAEQPRAKGHRIATDWGCVALLCNPDRNTPQTFLTGWANRVAQERNYGNVPQEPEEGRLVSASGLLQIAWPQRVAGADAPLDFLLATATRPALTGTPLSYPTVEMIANAWNADAGNHVEYFWKNNDCGIRTFQHDEIRARLHPRGEGSG